MRSARIDHLVAAIAAGQHGLITHAQALATGATSDMIQHRLEMGRWEQLQRAVYRVAGAPHTWHQSLMASVLAGGPDTAVSHRAAARLWGLPGFDDCGVEVVVAGERDHLSSIAIVHRTRVLPAHHVTTRMGITVTTPARMVFDLAGVLHPKRTERTLDNSIAARITDLGRMADMLTELGKRGRKGTGVMRRLLEDRGAEGYIAPASELEGRFIDILRSAGIPAPVRQHPAGDHRAAIGRIDFAYPAARLLIEIDSRTHHTALLDFENDRERDNKLMAAGWRVLRITRPILFDRPDEVLRLVQSARQAAA